MNDTNDKNVFLKVNDTIEIFESLGVFLRQSTKFRSIFKLN